MVLQILVHEQCIPLFWACYSSVMAEDKTEQNYSLHKLGNKGERDWGLTDPFRIPLNDLSISKWFHNHLENQPLIACNPTGIQGPHYNLYCVYLYIYLFIGRGTHMVWHVCGIQRTNSESLHYVTLYTTWALGIELVSSSLAASMSPWPHLLLMDIHTAFIFWNLRLILLRTGVREYPSPCFWKWNC